MRARFLLAAALVAGQVALLCACGSESSKDQSSNRASTAVADWPVYGANAAGTRYSPLTEIRRENVARREIAWTLHTGDVGDGRDSKLAAKTTFEATPLWLLRFQSPCTAD